MVKPTQLTEEMVQRLNRSPLISVITVDPDSLHSQINAVSWVRAHFTDQRIRLAVGLQSECLANIEKGSPVTLGWIDSEAFYMLRGTTTLSDVKSGAIKYRIIDLAVQDISDVMFFGGAITQVPTYRKTYDPELVEKMDREIEASLEEGWTLNS